MKLSHLLIFIAGIAFSATAVLAWIHSPAAFMTTALMLVFIAFAHAIAGHD